MIKKRLMTPGPVTLYPPALAAALEANIHHRTDEFRAILSDTMERLRRIFGHPEHLFLFASSGSGAMEAAITNFFSPGEQVIIASCGKFGERWIQLAERFALKPTILQYPYGEAVDPDEIRSVLQQNSKVKGVLLQACESSTGIQNDVESVSKLVKDSSALFVVDGVSALGTMHLSVTEGIDVLISGSQKALMIPPGLAFLGATEKAWKIVENSTNARYYFDLRQARKSWDQGGQTPFTPATSLVLSLQKSLETIEQWGLERLIRITENRSRAVRAGIEALSLKLFARRSHANALTAVLPPEGQAGKIVSIMKQNHGFHLAGGQGEMKNKIFRISHMGYIDHFDLLGALGALELTLKQIGLPVDLGSGVTAFQKVAAELQDQ